jgi:hypothetical protein
MKNYAKYRKDAAANYETHTKRPNPANNVSKWVNIKIEATGNARIMAGYGGSTHVPLLEIGHYFVRQILGINATDVLARSIPFLMTAASEYISKESCQARFDEFKMSLSSTAQAAILTDIVDQLLLEKLQSLNENGTLLDTISAVEILPRALLKPPVIAETAELIIQANSPKVCSEKNDLLLRHDIKSMVSTTEKIHAMHCLWLGREEWSKPLTNGANTFFKKFLRPTMNCLFCHFDGSVPEFSAAYPTFNHTTFADKCCTGKGNTCTRKH